jgi:hypothetical protein
MIHPDTPIFTRAEALARGLLKYWNGKPCKHGHHAMRYSTNAMCEQCLRGHARASVIRRNQGRAGHTQGHSETRTVTLRPEECATFDAFMLALELSRPDPAPFVMPAHIARLPPGAISGASEPVILTGDLAAQVAATLTQLTGGREPPPTPPYDDATPYDLPVGVLLPIPRL